VGPHDGGLSVMNGILNAASGIWNRFWASDAVTLVLVGVAIGFVFALALFTVTRWRRSSLGDLEAENLQEDLTEPVVQEVGGPFGGALFPCA